MRFSSDRRRDLAVSVSERILWRGLGSPWGSPGGPWANCGSHWDVFWRIGVVLVGWCFWARPSVMYTYENIVFLWSPSLGAPTLIDKVEAFPTPRCVWRPTDTASSIWNRYKNCWSRYLGTSTQNGPLAHRIYRYIYIYYIYTYMYIVRGRGMYIYT